MDKLTISFSFFLEIVTFFFLFYFLVKNLKSFVEKHSINKTFLIILTSVKVLFLFLTLFYGEAGNALDSKSIYDMSTIFSETLFISLKSGSVYGSEFMSLLIFPFTKLGKLSYVNLSIIFMLIGLYASLLFYVVLRKYSQNSYHHFLCMIIILYPTLNFFTSYITKDLIIFFLLSYLLFLLNFEYGRKNFIIKLFLIAILILFVRPYIFITLATSSVIVFSIFNKFQKKNLISFLTVLIILTPLIFLLFITKYNRVFEDSENYFVQFLQYLDYRAEVTNIGNSKINLLTQNLHSRFIHILFGKNIFYLNFSNVFYFIDKIFLVFIFSHILLIKIDFNKNKFNKYYLYEYSLLLYSVLLFVLLALSVSNYGIALRLKLMFLPIFFYFIFKNIKIGQVKYK